MTKVYLTGSESINSEIKEFLDGKVEFTETIESAGIIINTTNFPEYEKTEELQYIESHSPKNIPILTSSLCISVSNQCTLQVNPERLIGIGLYDTFSKANRIEIAPSKITDSTILKNAESFLTEAGISYSIVPDRVGMIFPRIVSMIINEAAQVYSEQVASKEDIDTAMKLGTNYPYGPL
ncbi:MAG: 3-hydroxyacyl-CoA dehydrogenase family protein, partial [Ignavibacteria bacterium]